LEELSAVGYIAEDMSDDRETRPLHVLTLTPFYPHAGNEADGPFVAEPLVHLSRFNVVSTIIAAKPMSIPAVTPTDRFPIPIWVRHLELPGKAAYGSWGWFMYARLRWLVARLRRRQPIDLIHAHAALPCGQAAALLSRQLRIPFIITTHGVDVMSTGRETGLSRWWCERVTRSVYQQANQNICVSELSRRKVLSGVGSPVKTTVVYNGVDTELFAPANGSDDRANVTILSVGRLTAVKAQDVVLHAMARLADQFPLLRCEIIGTGEERSNLLALAKDLNIADRVELLGTRSRREVAEAMQRCTVFALPSREEAMGCVFLEAMATAKPVIACHGEGIAEIIRHGENGWLVEHNNLEQLSHALATLLADASLRSRLGQAGRKTMVERLTLAHQAEQLNQVYRACLQEFAAPNHWHSDLQMSAAM
jgi:glycosyltransferase involved in cell wall biosynthesis